MYISKVINSKISANWKPNQIRTNQKFRGTVNNSIALK